MSLDKVFAILIAGSPLELLALFIMAGYFQMIVYGWVHKAVVVDRDDWKRIAQDAVAQNQQLLEILESGKRGGGRG